MQWLQVLRRKVVSWIGIGITAIGIILQPDVWPQVQPLIPAKYAHLIVALGVVLAALGKSLSAPTPPPASPTRG